MQHSANCAQHHIYLHFDLIRFLFHLLVFIAFHWSLPLPQYITFFYLCCFLPQSVTFFYLCLCFSLIFLSFSHRTFPDLLILSFFISVSPTSHAHTRICFNLAMCPWHKCICSIPPANRLVGCYQRQEDGDNGFHHIFSLPQIKMGQVTRHTQTHTHSRSLTHTVLHTLMHVMLAKFLQPIQQQNIFLFCCCSIGFHGQSNVTS